LFSALVKEFFLSTLFRKFPCVTKNLRTLSVPALQTLFRKSPSVNAAVSITSYYASNLTFRRACLV